MNSLITNNLYEFWREIGNLTNKLNETEYYSAVSMNDSDWPNRIFDLKDKPNIIKNIIKLSQEEKLPEKIVIKKSYEIKKHPALELSLQQKNMALDLKSITKKTTNTSNIQQVKSKTNSINFAKVASKSFGYNVNYKVVYKIVTYSKSTRLFTYQENNVYLGCGIVFFDSHNNAGLHMIGTIPAGRAKGIGKSMTEHLVWEAKNENMNFCVLNASIMGEPIYKKIGFEAYDEIETYKILKNKNNQS